MNWKQYGKIFALAAPMIFFPFSRSYHFFYVLLIGCAFVQAGSIVRSNSR